MGPLGRVRGTIGIVLRPLAVLLTGGSLPIDLLLSLLTKIELSLLLPLLDVLCLEVQPSCLVPLQQMTARLTLALLVSACGPLLSRTSHEWFLVVTCPPLLREMRTMTALVPAIPWTLTGMTLSGLSWPSSGTSIAWRNRQESLLLDARLLLHRSMG